MIMNLYAKVSYYNIGKAVLNFHFKGFPMWHTS